MERCPKCHRSMIWGGMAVGHLICPICDMPDSANLEVVLEETITSLKNAGKCYCHLLVGRVCLICKPRNP